MHLVTAVAGGATQCTEFRIIGFISNSNPSAGSLCHLSKFVSYGDLPGPPCPGGDSSGCRRNAGSAGTVFDVTANQLRIGNGGKASRTRTPLFSVPSYPLYWDSLVLHAGARVVALTRSFRIRVKSLLQLKEGADFAFGDVKGEGHEDSELEVFVPNVTISDSTFVVSSAGSVSELWMMVILRGWCLFCAQMSWRVNPEPDKPPVRLGVGGVCGECDHQ